VVDDLWGSLLVVLVDLVHGLVEWDHLVDLLHGGDDLMHRLVVLVNDGLVDLHDMQVVLVQIVLVDSVLVEIELVDVVDVEVVLVQMVTEDDLLGLVVLDDLVLVVVVVDDTLLVSVVVVHLVHVTVGLSHLWWGPSPSAPGSVSTSIPSIFSPASTAVMVDLMMVSVMSSPPTGGLSPPDGEENRVGLVGHSHHQKN
jgi:hypothetical protein